MLYCLILPNSVFATKLSTSLVIVDNMQYVYDNLDQGNAAISFFLDFSKAFDCVDHDSLREKMNIYGVAGVALGWFESYLSNRQQYASLNPLMPRCVQHLLSERLRLSA